ncbi:protein trichome birefringence-like 39 [Andrographis paniculata]|uniref:protein trichome birefringence-like 39 n=1 Tax=Andrographis paniculata TaxID=175694 RepID=UPI0021E8C2BC|nr:protein trichome birefringence-like 39 [Andrographis paniculata]
MRRHLLEALFAAAAFLLPAAAAAVQASHHLLNTTGATTSGGGGGGRCNMFRGKWVFDGSYPLYDYSKCPFMYDEFNCLKFRRPDRMYLKYRWQPFSCNLPRFNGLYFLEKFRGKKIMFVGDSMSLNMWVSLSCMIHSWVPNARTAFVRTQGLSEIAFLDYGVKLLLYRTPFLVDMESQKAGRVLKLDSIRSGNSWMGMDILIFNSWHWWTHTGRTQPWDLLQERGKLYKDMNRMIAYYKGLTTWARWINRNVDPSKTRVFFQGISPTHYEGSDWNEPLNSCKGEVQPFWGLKYPAGIPLANVVVDKVLSRIKKPVYLLDITALSQYRKDAHPTYYGRHGLDCSHWCLPGLPDTWNLLLYAALFNK